MIKESVLTTDIQAIVALLIISSLVSMITKRIKIPYTLALVLVGLTIGSINILPSIHLTPNLIFYVFLPPLLFESAWNLNLKLLKENILHISIYAIFGVIISTLIIGTLLYYILGVPIVVSLLFGAMISATDPVSVLALFKKMSLPAKLTNIVEGESLFNDGTSVVIFKIILAIVLTGVPRLGFSNHFILMGIFEFVIVVLGGALVGLIVGYLFSKITSFFDDPSLEITLTTIVAYGSFLLAESIPVPYTPANIELHLSGVIATIIAGLVVGNYGRVIGMSPTTRSTVNSFWEYINFIVNSFVFLLIGLQINLTLIYNNLSIIMYAILAILLGRMVVIYGLTYLLNSKKKDVIPLKWQHVMYWGGLRGSLSMALALSLPIEFEYKEFIIILVFGVVLFTLIFQGLSISGLIKYLGIKNNEIELYEYQEVHSCLLASSAAINELDKIHKRNEISDELYDILNTELNLEKTSYIEKAAKYHSENKEIILKQKEFVEKYLIEVKKDKLNQLLRNSTITEEVYNNLCLKYDDEIEKTNSNS